MTLTRRQSSVFQAAAVGLSSRQTAEWLGCSQKTVETYKMELRRLTGARTMAQAVAIVMRQRLDQPAITSETAATPRYVLLARAQRARAAIREGADPFLALAVVCWPPPGLKDAA